MGLEAHALAALLLTGAAFALFASDKLPIETVSLLVLVALAAGFTAFPYERQGVAVSPAAFFFGFGHEALVAIASLMILGRGLVVTGALEPAARVLARLLEARPQTAMLAVLVLSAATSGVLNDTPIVVLMMPILVGAALRTRTSPARTLLPMNYAVLIGGMGTTIGTSTNLIVVSIAADLGVRRFGIFDFAHVTAIAAVAGLAYLWLVLPRLIPERASPLADASPQVFAAALHVKEGGFADGKSLADVQAAAGDALRIRRIVRGDRLELARLPSLVLQPGDRLFLAATAKELHEFSEQLGAPLYNPGEGGQPVDADHPLAAEDQRLAEVVVTQGSALNGSTLRDSRFGEWYDVTIVGLHRPGRAAAAKTDIAAERLRVGDVLLVQGTPEAIGKLKSGARLLVLDESYELPRTERAPLALAILALVVLAAALKLAPISVAALAGVAAMILTRCLAWDDVATALSMKVVLLIASSLALGAALEQTGATAWLAAQFVAATRGLSGEWVLAALMLVTALFTNFVSNSAAAAVGTPIAVSIARELGISPEPLVLAILFGANFCYVTPMAYQTNLLVMSAAGYRFSDFVRGGLPLLAIMLAAYALLLPRFFPL